MMAEVIKFPLKAIKFPTLCCVCVQPAPQTFTIQQVQVAGNVSRTISIGVPMCEAHYAKAIANSARKRLIERVGVGLGLVIGGAFTTWLLTMWTRTQQGNIWVNIPLALIVGCGMWLVTWILMTYWIAPQFADKGTKKSVTR